MSIALVLVIAGAMLLALTERGWGWTLLAPGATLWFGVVVYRILTATAED